MIPENIVILAKNEKAARNAAQVLDKRGIAYRLEVGRYAGHIGELAEQITKEPGEHTLIVVGGDGLLNEVVNHICDFSRVTLGLIPSGSGNDFARHMKISKHPEKAMEHILAVKEAVHLDIGLIKTAPTKQMPIKERRFMVSAGAGFDAAVCIGVDVHPLKKILTRLGQAQFIYTLAALPLLLRCKHVPVRIMADGKTVCDKQVFFAATMNTSYEGGGYRFCPDAVPADGKIDMAIASGVRPWMVPKLLLLCRKGAHRNMKQIGLYRAETIAMHFAYPVAVHTDGEVYGMAETIELSMAKDKLRFLY